MDIYTEKRLDNSSSIPVTINTLMKKALIAPLIFVLFVLNSNAQNVGIGTTSPLEKLHISNGQIKLSRTASYNNNVIFNMPASQLVGDHEGLRFLLAGVEKSFIVTGAGSQTWASIGSVCGNTVSVLVYENIISEETKWRPFYIVIYN